MLQLKQLSGSIRHALPATLLAATLGATLYGPVADAADATGTVSISASVTTDCTVGSTNLNFGTVTSSAVQAGNIDAAGTVAVTCTSGTSYTIKLDVGAGSGATFATRKMTSGGNTLNYSIYDTNGRTNIWGDGTGGTVTVAGTGNGASQSVSAYGRIFSGQTPAAASYTDTINVTVSY